MTDRPVVNFFQIASLVMLLVTVALLSAVTTMHFAIHGAEVQVPPLKGMTVADARTVTSGLGLDLDVDNRYYSADIPAGHILTQSPVSGTVVRREWRVRVAESLGPQTVEVPDTVGTEERVAALRLRRVGLDVGATAHMAYGKATDGVILAQDPPAHAKGIAQPSVNLLVATPSDEAPDGYVMPDLVGMPVASAQASLVRLGLRVAPARFIDVPIGSVGAPGTQPRPPVAPGSIIAQQPPAGWRVDQTMQIRLTVAK
jgi:beta-lactam-binding protein with PASTA domain